MGLYGLKFCIFLVLYMCNICHGTAPYRSFGQLPTSLTPTRYQLNIQPYFPAEGIAYPTERNFTFDANVTIHVDCLDDTKNMTLNMLNIQLDKKSIQLIDAQSNGMIEVLDYVYDNGTQQVSFMIKDGLKTGKSYKLYLKYTGLLDADALAGFYPSQYVEYGQTKWLAVSQMEPVDARRVLPCFDEPFYKAVFEVTIIHPTSMIALSNGMEQSTVKLGDGWSRTVFEPTLSMSSYLLALFVSEFQSKSAYTADKKTLFRVWARPSFINKTDYAVMAGPKVLDYYADYFNIPFPLKKQEMIALPDFAAGAMENWGLVTYRETSLLYDESISTSSDLRRVALVIAHELAHQWFGDLVTMEWWDDIWLNEGFANYMEYPGSDVISDGKLRMDQYIVSDAMCQALSLDQLSTSHPIFVPVSLPDEINEIFDDISYAKGSSIIRMLNYTISDMVLREGLRIYLAKHKYKNANHNDLWSAISEAVLKGNKPFKDWRGKPLNVTEFMNPWVLQMGYPVLNVNRQYDSQQKIATIDQERFLISNKTVAVEKHKFESPPFNYTWYVPIWYQIANTIGIQSAWLQPYQTLSLFTGEDDDWLLVNYESAAYCRVNYDERNWRLLIKQLQNDHQKIHAKNRIQLVDDSMKLARAGRLPYEIALDITLYLVNETDSDPWTVGYNNLNFIKSMLAQSPGYQDYKKLTSALTYPTYVRLGWDDKKEPIDDINTHNLRSVVLYEQCWLDLEDCIQKADVQFKKFVDACSQPNSMSSSCSPIPPNIRTVVYCVGGKYEADDSWWELLWSLYATEQVASEKDHLIKGMGCTKKRSLIMKLLNEAINENSTAIRRQDGANVFQYLSINDIARPLLWPFIVENWVIIRKLYGHGMLGLNHIFEAATESMNTDENLEMLRKFYKDHSSELGVAKRAFEQCLETVDAASQWMKQNGVTVIQWLKNQPLPLPPSSSIQELPSVFDDDF